MRWVSIALVWLAACAGDDEMIVDAGTLTTDGSTPVDAGAVLDAATDATPAADATPSADAGSCPSGFMLAANARCYHIDAAPLTWISARGQCQSMGGYLAQPEDAAEDAVVHALVGFDAWIGGYDAVVEGTWLWASTGQPIGLQPWAAGEPDDAAPGQDCLGLLADGTWSDLGCDQLRGHLCETD